RNDSTSGSVVNRSGWREWAKCPCSTRGRPALETGKEVAGSEVGQAAQPIQSIRPVETANATNLVKDDEPESPGDPCQRPTLSRAGFRGRGGQGAIRPHPVGGRSGEPVVRRRGDRGPARRGGGVVLEPGHDGRVAALGAGGRRRTAIPAEHRVVRTGARQPGAGRPP